MSGLRKLSLVGVVALGLSSCGSLGSPDVESAAGSSGDSGAGSSVERAAGSSEGTQAVSPQVDGTSKPQDLTFWDHLIVQGQEAQHFTSLAEMTAASDAVVLAVPVAYEVGEIFNEDGTADGGLASAAMELDVVEQLAGAPVGERIEVLFAVTGTVEQAIGKIETASPGLPDEAVLLFLISGAPERPDIHGLVHTSGLWVEGPPGVVAPLAIDDLGQPYPDEIEEHDTLASLARAIQPEP